MRLALVASVTALLLGACANDPGYSPTDAAGSDVVTTVDATRQPDGAPSPDVTAVPDGGVLVGDDVVLLAPPRPELCGNNFDDNGDGQIDEHCDCNVGTERACWFGPLAAHGVGVCHDGSQSCQSTGATAVWGNCEGEVLPGLEVLGDGLDNNCDGTVDEPTGVCVPRSNGESDAACANGVDDDCDSLVDCDDPGCASSSHCAHRCAATETVCWGGADEDCDGDIDCADRDCATSPSCATGPCPSGQTPVYTQRPTTSAPTSSGIITGDGQAVMPLTCQPGRCPVGQVGVVLAGQTLVCVPPPASCPTGQSPVYLGGVGWRCAAPCQVVVQFGYLYGFRRVCASRPTDSCASGSVPTFDATLEQWVCRPRCSNTTYDQVLLDGVLVCVPC